jgi:DNA-binding LytR/AlgR family response regulator
MWKIGVIGPKEGKVHDLIAVLSKFGYEVPPLAYTAIAIDRLLLQHKPDLLLIDISEADEKMRACISDRLPARTGTPFIFITAEADSDAMQLARKMQPSAMLTGHVDPGTLYATIELALLRVGTATLPVIPDGQKESQGLVLHGVEAMIPFIDFLYIYSNHVYMIIVTFERDILHRITMQKLMKQLPATNFCRVHRGFVVNLAHVEQLQKNYLTIGNKEIPVSKSLRPELIARLKL